jgi:hypothetical protein
VCCTPDGSLLTKKHAPYHVLTFGVWIRNPINNNTNQYQQCLSLLNKLKTLCDTKTQIFNDRMTKVRSLLSPKQTVQLILWIKQNANTLSSVCPGWESEHKA